MVKIEAFEHSHFMHQTVRVYHTDSIVSEQIEVVCLSSFTGASKPRNDGASVFSVVYSTRMVHKIWD